MSQTPQALNKRDENADRITTSQPDALQARTSVGARVARDENGPTITRQPDARPAGRGISPGLARVLTGGLIGATLGILAGALANRRTTEGVNHAVKGVGEGVKTVGEGVNQAAKGVGYAVKSGAEGLNNTVTGAVDAVKDTAEGAKQSVVGAVDRVQDTAEGAKQSVVGAVDRVQDTAEDVKSSDNQSFKLDEERLVADNKQIMAGEIGIGERVETQTADISIPVEKELVVVEQIIPVDAETPVAPGEAHSTTADPWQ